MRRDPGTLADEMADREELTIPQGATWRDRFYIDALASVSGYEARMEVREAPLDTGAPALLTLTTDDLLMLGSDAEGCYVEWDVPAEETEDLDFADDEAVYDLELVAPDGHVSRLMEGVVTLSREVTR